MSYSTGAEVNILRRFLDARRGSSPDVTGRPRRASRDNDVLRYFNPFRYLMWLLLKKMELTAVSPCGDVGPGGRCLAERWGGAEYPSDDLSTCKLMLVATAGDGSVIGCCGFKRGTDEAKDAAEGEVFSVWRLSVSPKVRGKGLGRTLMEHGEGWARQRGCKKVLLYTGSPLCENYRNSRSRPRATDFLGRDEPFGLSSTRVEVVSSK